MLGPQLYDKGPAGAIPKPGKDAIVSSFATISERLQDDATPNAINNFIVKNPRFLGDTLIDSTLRANRDKKFLDVLNASIDEFKGLVDTLPRGPAVSA